MTMLRQPWHKVVIAYRLEDKHGNAPPYLYEGRRALLPCGYDYAYMNPCIFKEYGYAKYYKRYSMYQYFFFPFVLTYDTGEVLFKPNEVSSKTKLGGR